MRLFSPLISKLKEVTDKRPSYAKEPCSKCQSPVSWKKGYDSSSFAEAKFACTVCGYEEFRGGIASEFEMKEAVQA